MLIFKGNNIETNLHTLIILDFEKFLTSRRDEWETRQKEVEAKFLELSSLSDKLAAVPSEPKKRKRKAKSVNCLKCSKILLHLMQLNFKFVSSER